MQRKHLLHTWSIWIKSMNRVLQSDRFTGRVKTLRVISEHWSYWNRLRAYDEAEQRLTINDRGQVWLSRFDRPPNPFYPDQLLSKQYFRLSEKATKRIMDIATDWFSQYEYHRVFDVPKWHADLVNTDGKAFHIEGTQGYENPLTICSLTETIREELEIPDLLVIGDESLSEDDEEAPRPFWYESISLEEIMQQAEQGLGADHDCRVELLRALEYKYWDFDGKDKEKLNRLYTLMHKYVMSLEAERPVKRAKLRYAWDKFVD